MRYLNDCKSVEKNDNAFGILSIWIIRHTYKNKHFGWDAYVCWRKEG